MGVIKKIGNKQYQQEANGDWYEVPMPEENPITKVVDGRTYQKDRDGQWFDMGEVKKKDVLSKAGSGIGGQVGTSEAPLVKDNKFEVAEWIKELPYKTFESKDPIRDGIEGERKKVAHIINPDVTTGKKSTVNALQISQATKGLSDNVRSWENAFGDDVDLAEGYLQKELAAKGVKLKPSTQGGVPGLTDFMAEQNPRSLSDTPIQAFDVKEIEKGIDPNNKTQVAAFNTVKRMRGLHDAVSGGGSIDEMAAKFAGEDLKEMSEAKAGQKIDEFMSLPQIHKLVKTDNEFAQKYFKTKNDFYDNYPSYAQKKIAEYIGQVLEDEKMTGWLYANPSVKKTDKAVELLIERGVFNDKDVKVYEERIRPYAMIGAADKVIPLTDLIHNAGYGIYRGFTGVNNTLRDVVGKVGGSWIDPSGNSLFQNLGLMESNEAKDKRLEQTEYSTPQVTPSTEFRKFIAEGSHFAGFTVPMILGGAARIPQAATMILMFEGDNADHARKLFPGQIGKQNVYTTITTGIDATLAELLPTKQAAKGIKRLLSKDVQSAVEQLSSKNISQDVVKTELQDKIFNALTNIVKDNTKTGIVLTAFEKAHKGVEAAFGHGSFNLSDEFDSAISNYKTNWLMGTFLSAASAAGKGKGTMDRGKIYLEMANNADKYRDIINKEAKTNPEAAKEKLENLETLEATAQILEAQKIPIEKQGEYLELSLKQNVAQKKAAVSPDKVLAEKDKKIAEITEIEKARVLNPETTNTEHIEKLFDYLPKGSQERLSVDGKFNPSKVGEYIKFIAQQANGLDENFKPLPDGKKPSMSEIPESIVEIANDRWEKEVEDAQPKEKVEIDQVREPDYGTEPLKEETPSPEVREEVVPIQVEGKPNPVDIKSIEASEKWLRELFTLPYATKIKDKDGNVYTVKDNKLYDKDGLVFNNAKRSKAIPDFFKTGYEIVNEKPSNETSISSTEAKDKQSNISTEKESSVGEVFNEAGEGTTGGKPPEPPKVEEVKVEGEEELPERRFTKQMMRSDELSEASKGEIAKTLNYVRQTNEMNVKEANEVIDRVGVDEAQHLIMTDGELKPSVRVTLSQIVIKRYNDLAEKATDPAEKEFYLDKTIQTASFVTEKLATEAGQSIQAFSMWSRLSPEGQLRAANQDMARQGKEKMARREKDINKIGDKFKKANEETADEVSKTVGEKVKKTESERTKRAKDKVAAAKNKRENIIKKYKGDKGKNLYSSPTGLTKEGIEFVGELVATYVQEGVAKLEILVEKIIAHLKEVSGKIPNEEVKRNVEEIAGLRLQKDADKKVLSSVAGLEKEIGKILKEHYTVPEEAKKKLVDKFVDKAGLEKEDAERLAKEIEAEFDKIATRKKRNILYNEKARFDKINNTLKGDKTPEKKTVADDLIKYTNLGAFENADFAGMISEKFGIGKLTTEQAAKLKILADKIQKAPEGTPKRDATEDLLAYRAKLRGNDLGETAQGVWYANILSGYRTHEKNVISTFFNSIGEIGTEMFKDPKAIPYIMAGYFKGIAHRGRIEAANTLATGRSPIHIKKIETPNVLERKKFVGGVVNPANWFKYVMRMMIAEDVLSFQGLKEARAYQLARREASKMGYNTWSMKGWNKVNEILYHTKERYEAAKEQAIGEGVTGKRETKRRVYELVEESRPQKMTEDAYGFAARGTFNHEPEGSLGALTNAVAHTLDAVSVGGVKPLRFIVPFTRIITNVVNNSLDFTPVGLVRGARGVRGFKSFNENQYTKGAYKELSREERQRYIAKASIGILLTGTLQALHQAGVIEITGAGPDDDKKKRQLMQEGWQPYSIKIDGKYYSYQYTPLVFMTGFLGNMNDAAKYNDEDETTLFKRMEVALSRMGGQVADMTWINSASTFLGTLTDKSVRGQEKGIGDAFAGMARGFIPFGGAVTQANQAVQNVFGMPQKQVNNSWQALIQDIPIARNTLNDKINALGEPVTRDIDVFQSKETKDPVWKFLLDKQGWVAPPNRGTVIVFDQKTLQDRPLTNDEWYDFLVKRGKMLKDDITGIIKNGTWVLRDGQVKQVSADDIKTKELNMVLSRLESRATRRTKAEMFGEKEVDEDEKDLQKELKDALEDQFPNDDWR